MNNLIIILILFLTSFKSDAQTEVIGKTFKSNVLIGQKGAFNRGVDDLTLTLMDKTRPWGNFIRFKEDGTFESFNQNKCGNDCRIKISGNYNFKDGKIEFIVESIRYYDMCALKPAENNSFTYGVFAITTENDDYILKK